MCDDHKGIAGLTGVFLLGALAVGAATADAQELAPTAVLNVPQLQAVPTEPVGPIPANGSEEPQAKAAVGCTGIVVSATRLIFDDGFETGNTSAWGPGALVQFSAIRMLDLNLTVRFADGFSGDHLLHLKLLTPKGHHYQTLSVWTTSDPARSESLRRVDGYPRPVAVRLVQGAALLLPSEVTVSVPVGGTAITANSIYGMWTAEAYLDDQSEVCASQPFVLTP